MLKADRKQKEHSVDFFIGNNNLEGLPVYAGIRSDRKVADPPVFYLKKGGIKMKFEKEMVYGNELYYPIDESARILVRLSGKKTFTFGQVQHAKHLAEMIKTESQKIKI